MRIVSTVAVLLLVMFPASDAHAQGLSWGVKGGLVLSALETYGTGAFDTAPRSSVAGGGFIAWSFDRVRVQPELLFVNRRFDITDQFVPIKVAARSVELPILVDVRATPMHRATLHVQAGPQFNFIGRVEQKLLNQTVDISDDIDDVDVGIALGASLEVTQGGFAWTFEVRSNLGLRDLSAVGAPELRSRAGFFLLGLRF